MNNVKLNVERNHDYDYWILKLKFINLGDTFNYVKLIRPASKV